MRANPITSLDAARPFCFHFKAQWRGASEFVKPSAMKTFRPALLMAASLLILNGCVLVSMHSTRPVEVHVTDSLTHEPVSGANLSIQYCYDSYGVFYVLRMPDDVSACTDSNGIAVLPMATFGYGIVFHVAGRHFEVTPSLIRHGGYASGGGLLSRDPRTGEVLSTNPAPFVVQLTPKR